MVPGQILAALLSAGSWPDTLPHLCINADLRLLRVCQPAAPPGKLCAGERRCCCCCCRLSLSFLPVACWDTSGLWRLALLHDNHMQPLLYRSQLLLPSQLHARRALRTAKADAELDMACVSLLSTQKHSSKMRPINHFLHARMCGSPLILSLSSLEQHTLFHHLSNTRSNRPCPGALRVLQDGREAGHGGRAAGGVPWQAAAGRQAVIARSNQLSRSVSCQLTCGHVAVNQQRPAAVEEASCSTHRPSRAAN